MKLDSEQIDHQSSKLSETVNDFRKALISICSFEFYEFNLSREADDTNGLKSTFPFQKYDIGVIKDENKLTQIHVRH